MGSLGAPQGSSQHLVRTPEVKRVASDSNTRPPTSTSTDQVSAAAGNSMVREPVTDFHRDGALTAVGTAVTLGTTVHAPSAECADARNPTSVYADSVQHTRF